MIRVIHLLVLMSIFALPGCIQFTTTKVASISEIDQWLDNKNYGKALEAAREHRKKHASAEIDNKISEITEKADQYDLDESTAIYTLINNQNINLAKQDLQRALENYPQGKRLNKIRSYLKDSESIQISRLQAQQLLAKSEWLLRAKLIQDSLHTIKPESNGTFTDPSADIEETAAELYHLGLKAMQKGDLELADSCLTMSNKLHSLPFTISAMARLEILREQQRQQNLHRQKQAIQQKRVVEIQEEQKNQKENQKLQKKQQAQIKLEFDTLYYSTASMLKENQLSTAKTNLDKLNKMMPGNEKLARLNKEFSDKLPSHVEALLTRGRQLYINGKIAKARDIWIKAQKLDPKNEEIAKNIERANRVLGRLDELKKKSTQ
jgi:hypothetical protein